ncbi:MAG: hypothetical protein ACR2N7_07285 [Acidimicrobiia bacterium]
MAGRQLFKLPVFVLVTAIPVVIAACGGSTEDASAVDVVPSTTMVMSDAVAHDDHSHDHDAESTQLREWAGSPVPTVELSLDDSMGHTMLVIEADGFTFTSAAVTDPVDGEGHAHLYVDGKLLTMIYKPDFRIPDDVSGGMHELIVTLSTNDHLEYASSGEPIGAAIMIGMADESGSDASDDHSDQHGSAHVPPVVPDDAVVETAHGVVTDVVGNLVMTESFTLTLEDGSEATFYPTADATFHGGPISHIRDHLLSGVPVTVQFVVMDDGTYAATDASDH